MVSGWTFDYRGTSYPLTLGNWQKVITKGVCIRESVAVGITSPSGMRLTAYMSSAPYHLGYQRVFLLRKSEEKLGAHTATLFIARKGVYLQRLTTGKLIPLNGYEFSWS